MKRKAIFGTIAGLVIVAAAYTGAAWWTGKSAEQTIQKQTAWLKNQPYLVVKKQTYDRGLFRSEVVTTLAINPSLYAFIVQQTGNTEIPVFEVTYKQHITHGPLPLLSSFNPMPYKAVVDTEFVFSADAQKFLARFFGQQKPISIVERIAFNDDSKANISIPAFDYEEAISGIKIKWGGFTGTMEYSGDLSSRFKFHGQVPSLFAQLKPKGVFSLNNLVFERDNTRGNAGLMLGTDTITLDQLDINWLDQIPMHLVLNKIAYGTKLSETGEYIQGEGKFDVASFLLDQKSYGPVKFVGQAKHLHAPTLAKLSQEVTRLQKEGIATGIINEDLIWQVFQQNGLPLLEHDPEFLIQELSVKTPDGDIHVDANLALRGFKEPDIKQPLVLLSKIDAQANISIPREILESAFIFQTQMLLGIGNENSAVEMQNLIRQMVQGQINKLVQDKFIRLEGNNIVTNAALKGGNLTLNGMPVVLPWQEPALAPAPMP